jgi:hypothetical protein
MGMTACYSSPNHPSQKNLNKEDRKKLNKALTYHYIKEQADGDDTAKEMEKRLEKAVDK